MIPLLKDSCREALDRKIFAAMLVLSGILILFVASISFKPITLEDELKTMTGMLTWSTGFNPHLGKSTYAIDNFRQTNDAKEPWKGDYAFDWVVTAKNADTIKQQPMTKLREVRMMVKEGMNFLDNVEVADNSSTNPAEVRYAVTTKGTKVNDVLAWRHEPRVLFAVPLPFMHFSLREGVYFIENSLIGGFGAWVAVLIGVIVTASFIPNLLQKGSVDLLLAKPVRRPALLIYKYLGGLIFVFLLTSFTVLGVWTAIGLRTGVWTPGFLLVIPAVTFSFALLYSVSTLVAVFTRSTVVAILMTVAVWFGLWLAGLTHSVLDGIRKKSDEAEKQARVVFGGKADAKPADDDGEERKRNKPMQLPNWLYTTSDLVYKALPRTRDLNRLTDEWVAKGLLTENEMKTRGLLTDDRPNWIEVFGVNGAFITIMLGLACWRFSTADY